MSGVVSAADATIIVALIGAVIAPVVLFILHRRSTRILADLEAVRRETAIQRRENTEQHGQTGQLLGQAGQLLATVADGLHMVVGKVDDVAGKVDVLAVKLDGHIENHGTPPQEAPK